MNPNEEIIDPELMSDALMEAMGEPVREEVTILQLLNGHKIKVRYLPQSIGTSLEYDHGTPTTPPGTRKIKFDYRKWVKDTVQKMNDLALKNVQIVNDITLDGKVDQNIVLRKGEIRMSLIGPGEFSQLRELCFPGADSDAPDSEVQPDEARRKSGKGVRGRQPDVSGEAVRAT